MPHNNHWHLCGILLTSCRRWWVWESKLHKERSSKLWNNQTKGELCAWPRCEVIPTSTPYVEHMDNMWISVNLLLSVSFTCVNPHCPMKVDWECMAHVGGQIVFPKTENNKTCKISQTIFRSSYLKNHFSTIAHQTRHSSYGSCNLSASSPSRMAVPSIRSQAIHRFEEKTNRYEKQHWVSYTNELTNKTWAKQLTFS
jgi:hypothetical protein